MQAGKKAAETVKETAANVAASARSGMEKTKATVQEKVEKSTTRDPVKREMATEKKEARIAEAELHKQEARGYNAAEKDAKTVGARADYTTPGAEGYPTGPHVMSAVPRHGTGAPAGKVDEVVQSHPYGSNTGTQRPNPAHNPHVGGNSTGYGTGGYTT